jgi:hypothetical protein
MRVADTSMLAGSEQAPAAAANLLKNAVQGAHDGIDRLGERVSAAGVTLTEKTAQLRETRDAWTEGVRCTVRQKPLASLAVALALGGVIALLMRGKR